MQYSCTVEFVFAKNQTEREPSLENQRDQKRKRYLLAELTSERRFERKNILFNTVQNSCWYNQINLITCF